MANVNFGMSSLNQAISIVAIKKVVHREFALYGSFIMMSVSMAD